LLHFNFPQIIMTHTNKITPLHHSFQMSKLTWVNPHTKTSVVKLLPNLDLCW
jgi:hypothetical protein